MGTEAYYNHTIFKGLRNSSDISPLSTPPPHPGAGHVAVFIIRSTVFIRCRGNP